MGRKISFLSEEHLLLVTLLTVALHCIDKSNCSSVLVADFRMTRMVELSSRPPYCKIHSDRGDIQRMLLAADTRKMRQVPQESVIALEEVCIEAGSISGELQGGLGFIYPGTKWCGPGNIASNYSDVGRYAAEDQCCREHDLCPNILLPGECRRGLCNRGAFTRSHCDCDARFRRCLQNLNTETANTLGAIFFNVVQVTCFGERRPCSDWQSNNPPEESQCKLQFYFSGTYHLPVCNRIQFEPNVFRNSRSFDSGTVDNEVNSSNRQKLKSFGLISQSLFKDLFRIGTQCPNSQSIFLSIIICGSVCIPKKGYPGLRFAGECNTCRYLIDGRDSTKPKLMNCARDGNINRVKSTFQ